MAKRRHTYPRLLSNAKVAVPFPFLRLPREIRDCIYRFLLLTRYNYVETRGRWYYQLSPAILLACKQTADEGRKILYSENELITVWLGIRSINSNISQYEVNEQGRKELNFAFLNIPRFRLSPKKINPVLSITVRTREQDYRFITDSIILVTTPEGIDRVMQYLWSSARICGFGRDTSFELCFHRIVSSRRRYFNEHVMKQWGDIQGFRAATINGVDEDVHRYLFERLSHGPQLIDVSRRIGEIASRAEYAFQRKCYEDALNHWYHLQKYWCYRYYVLSSEVLDEDSKKLLLDSLEATLPLMIKAKLGVTLSNLHLQHWRGYKDALSSADYTAIWIRTFIDIHNLKYRPNPVVEMKLYVCSFLAQTAVGYREVDKKAIENIASALSQIEQYNDTNMDKFYRARDRYLKLTKAVWGTSEKGYTALKWRVRNFHLGPECRPFWDLLELPEEAPISESL